MIQTHTGPREDAETRRREYVRKKALAHGLTLIGGVTAVGCTGLAVMPLLGAIGFLLLWHGAYASESIPMFGFVALSCIAAFLAVWLCRSSWQTVKSLPYVPPVAEQIAALPADEVLVRASDAPLALPGELLRAARAGIETDAQEFLRAESRRP